MNSPAITALRTEGFHALLAGEPTTLGSLAVQADLTRADLDLAAAELQDQGSLELDDDTVTGTHGLTTRSTPHRFTHAGRDVNTWCALDAIGIPAALDLDTTVHTTCPACTADLAVPITRGRPAQTGAVLFLPTGPCSNLMRDFCTAANLFCNQAHLDRWQDQHHGSDGRTLSLVEVAELGQQLWADITTEPQH